MSRVQVTFRAKCVECRKVFTLTPEQVETAQRMNEAPLSPCHHMPVTVERVTTRPIRTKRRA